MSSSSPMLKEREVEKCKLLKDLITTPYEKVLLILAEAKRYISLLSKTQSKLIRDLEWTMKVITSHSLYTYDINNNEMIEQYQKESPEFKQFIQFVHDYNEEVIEVNKKNNILLTKSAQMSFNELNLHTPSMNLKKSGFRSGVGGVNGQIKKKKKTHSHNLIIHTTTMTMGKTESIPNQKLMSYATSSNIKTNAHNALHGNNTYASNKLTIGSLKKIINKGMIQDNNNKDRMNYYSPSNYNSNSNFNHSNSNDIKLNTSINKSLKQKRFHTPLHTETKHTKYNSIYIEGMLNKANYDVKKILQKDFDIFELKSIVGHSNVLPLIGKTIFEAFGISDKMINTKKLDSFLIAIEGGYISNVLYHNSVHGADVTQTVTMLMMNSNAEEVAETNVADILSLITASLGHDIGHPGFTNGYQINSYSELALTYNDISCLENFHTAKLFKVSRINENNIFEKMTQFDYKNLRKRIISMILATDMANHGKVLSVIKAKIPNEVNEPNGNTKFELINKESKNIFEEQQSLLDFFIHSADLAHNTKQFSISLQWVELLSKEFWDQGDKEKSLNLPVSFLCERIDHDIPKSQVGFIKGFILPTFEVLVNMFPTLKYLTDNSKENLHLWELLVKDGRKKGWSPKERREKEKEKDLERERGMSKDKDKEKNKKTYNANWGKPKLLVVNNKGKKSSSFLEHSNNNTNNSNIGDKK